jgi:NAD(P)H dehydrogenase (quinone)
MRVLAVLAHPNKHSLNAHLFNAAIEQLKKHGAIVDVLNLYEHAHRIPFYDRTTIHTNEFFLENKERFMAADRLLIVHPVWWYSVPGILKSWLDLITNFAWKYKGGSTHAQALHNIKKALVINTAGMSNFVRWFCTRNSATAQVKQTFKFIDLTNAIFYEIGSTDSLTPELIKKHTEKIMSKADWLAE